LQQASDDMIKYAAQSSISANQMEEKLAEIFNIAGKQSPFQDVKASMSSILIDVD
jgi:hypothetical protein